VWIDTQVAEHLCEKSFLAKAFFAIQADLRSLFQKLTELGLYPIWRLSGYDHDLVVQGFAII